MGVRTGLAAALVLGVTACAPSTSSGPPPEAATPATSCPTYSPAPALPRDRVLGVEVLHAPTAVVIELRQRDITTSDDQSWAFALATPDGSWTVDVLRDGRRTEPMLYSEPAEPSPSPDPDSCGIYGSLTTSDECPDVTAVVSPWDDTVQVVVPRRCLADPAWVRVGATVWDGDHEATYSSPELGPRVTVS